MWKDRLQQGKNNNPTKTHTATRTILLRMLFVICCIIEHTFWNRLAIPFHSLLFPVPQVSLKVSSKVTLFMNFSNWNALLRIVILPLCDLVWKPASTKLKRTLWIKAVRLDTEVYNEHKSMWGPVLLPQKWAARVCFWFCLSSYKSSATSLKHTSGKSEQAVFQPLNSQHITHCI